MVVHRALLCQAGGAWHAVLGLTATATLQEVKWPGKETLKGGVSRFRSANLRQAFRDLALLHHPDKGFQSCDDTSLGLAFSASLWEMNRDGASLRFRVVRLAYQQAITNFQEKAKASPPGKSQRRFLRAKAPRLSGFSASVAVLPLEGCGKLTERRCKGKIAQCAQRLWELRSQVAGPTSGRPFPHKSYVHQPI